MSYLHKPVKSAENAEPAAALPTLGFVPRFPRNRTDAENLVVGSPQQLAAAEAYRVLRTNLQFGAIDAQALLVSSANPDEGKSTMVANLAVAIAQTGQRVVVVDSDLRCPALHRFFGLSNTAGLTNALLSAERLGLSRLLQPSRFEDLSVLTSGPLLPQPKELLSSQRMDAVVAALQTEAEITLFDSPPALAHADASILAAKVDGTILVADAGRTRVQSVQRAAEVLERSKTREVGVILNRLIDGGHGLFYPTSSPPYRLQASAWGSVYA